jgi:hypothetical protein
MSFSRLVGQPDLVQRFGAGALEDAFEVTEVAKITRTYRDGERQVRGACLLEDPSGTGETARFISACQTLPQNSGFGAPAASGQSQARSIRILICGQNNINLTVLGRGTQF